MELRRPLRIEISEKLANKFHQLNLDVEEKWSREDNFNHFYISYTQYLEFVKILIDLTNTMSKVVFNLRDELNKLSTPLIEIEELQKELRGKLEKKKDEINSLNIDENINQATNIKVSERVNSLMDENKINNSLNKHVRDLVVQNSEDVKDKIEKEINQKVDSIKKLLHFLQKRYKEYDERATKKLNVYNKEIEKKHREIEERYKSVEKEQNSTKNEDIKELTSENNEDEQELPQTLDID